MMPMTWFNPDEMVELHASIWATQAAIPLVGISKAAKEPTEEYRRNMFRSLFFLMYGASKACIFPQNTGGAKATATLGRYTFTAAKHGTDGNLIDIVIGQEGEHFTLALLFNKQSIGNPIQFTIETGLPEALYDLVDIVDSGTGDVIIGEVALLGGNNGTIGSYASRQQAYQDAAALRKWQVISFAMNPDEANYAQSRVTFRSWLRLLNDQEQVYRRGMMYGAFSDPLAGMDDFTLTVVAQEYEWLGEYWMTPADGVRLQTGLSAASPNNATRTADIVRNVTNVRPLLNHIQEQDADDRGLFILCEGADSGVFIVYKDINSFVSWVDDRNLQWRENDTIDALHDFMVRWHRIDITQIRGKVDNYQAQARTLKGEADNLFRTMELEGAFNNHDVSKLTVIMGVTPTTARIEAHDVRVTNRVIGISFPMRITW